MLHVYICLSDLVFLKPLLICGLLRVVKGWGLSLYFIRNEMPASHLESGVSDTSYDWRKCALCS